MEPCTVVSFVKRKIMKLVKEEDQYMHSIPELQSK